MNLRDELGGLANQSGPYADPDKALAKAKRRRATRLALAPLALVLAAGVGIPFAVNGFPGGGSPAANPSASQSEAPQLPELAVDYVTSDGWLVTTGGRVYNLAPWTGGVVQRVPAGWLVTGFEGAPYLLGADGNRTPLPALANDEGSHIDVSPDGTLLAWQMQDEGDEPGDFKVGRVTADGVEELASAPGTKVNSIAGWSGDRVAFFLADESAGSENADVSWGLWDYAADPFVTDWHPGSPDYIGTDDKMLFWDEPNGGYCLVQADADTGAETGRRCDLNVEILPSRVSPDGLYALGDPYGDTPMVFTVDDVFADPSAQAVPACGASGVMEQAWLGDVVYMIPGGMAGDPTAPSEVIACDVHGNPVSTTSFDFGIHLVQSYGD